VARVQASYSNDASESKGNREGYTMTTAYAGAGRMVAHNMVTTQF